MTAHHSDVHREVRRTVREFVAREIVPIADALDNAEAEIPMPVIRQMAELGYFGLVFPERLGGMGLDYLAMAIVAEELSRGWLSVGSVMTRMIITGSLLIEAGTEEQQQRFLPKIATGELLTAAAFTEPDAGSDTGAIKCRAVREGGGKGGDYVLRGEKTWCTFANRAHVLTVLARTDPDPAKRHKGLSMFLVEKEPGDHFHPPEMAGSPIPTIGYKGMKSYSLQFDGYRVPAENLLGGQEGRGFYQLMPTYEVARIQTAARAVGVAQAAFDAALRYAQERSQFGRPISDHQVIRHKLAHMATDIEAARQLCYYAATVKDCGGRSDLEAGYAKVFAAEMAERVTSEALQIFGGYGYSREFPVQRFWRDARVFRIFEGTSEIQYEVIAKRLLEGPGGKGKGPGRG
jgi:alkylation response protein AidB-like acyl-CoA dehydrogenase